MPRKKNTEENNDKLTNEKNKKEEQSNNRLLDIIGKMEEETKKAEQKNKKSKNKVKEIESKYEINSDSKKQKKSTKDKEDNKIKVEEKNKNKESEKKEPTKKETKKKESKISKTKEDNVKKENEEPIKNEKKESKKEKIKEPIKNSEMKALIEREEKLETIKNEIYTQTTLSKQKMKKIYSKIFHNVIFATVFLIYFGILNIGYKTINPESMYRDLKIISIIDIIITIIIFEIAYKKDSGKLAIRGIEVLLLSICTLLINYVFKIYNSHFLEIVIIIALLFSLYFMIKSLVIYNKERRKLKKKISK